MMTMSPIKAYAGAVGPLPHHRGGTRAARRQDRPIPGLTPIRSRQDRPPSPWRRSTSSARLAYAGHPSHRQGLGAALGSAGFPVHGVAGRGHTESHHSPSQPPGPSSAAASAPRSTCEGEHPPLRHGLPLRRSRATSTASASGPRRRPAGHGRGRPCRHRRADGASVAGGEEPRGCARTSSRSASGSTERSCGRGRRAVRAGAAAYFSFVRL